MPKISNKLISIIFGVVLLAGLFAVVVIKSKLPKVVCEPATTPWKIENFAVPNEYIYYPNVTITQVCTFSGHVSKDQLFKQAVAEGFAVCLLPINYLQNGWNITMTDEHDKNCDTDFSSPVTLPMHGWTPRDILGSSFVNQSSAQEIIGSIEKPVAEREFSFIFSRKDYKMIEDNWACWTYGINCPSDWGNTSKTPRSRGIFTITKIKLGNSASKDQVWIESMDFVVKVYLPADTSLQTK